MNYVVGGVVSQDKGLLKASIALSQSGWQQWYWTVFHVQGNQTMPVPPIPVEEPYMVPYHEPISPYVPPYHEPIAPQVQSN